MQNNFRNELTRFFVASSLDIPMDSVTQEQIRTLREQVGADQNLEVIQNNNEITTTMMELSNQLGILSLSSCNFMWSHCKSSLQEN